MNDFREQRIWNKIKGDFAETIFQCLHQELGVTVYRTGQEHLFPHLFHLANKQKKWHKNKLATQARERDSQFTQIIRELREKYGEEGAVNQIKRYNEELFSNQPMGIRMSSFPDFTIVTPSGEIILFEVKWRDDGILSQDDFKKLAVNHPEALFFVCSRKEPNIRFYQKDIIKELYEMDRIEAIYKEMKETVDRVFDGTASKKEEEQYKQFVEKFHARRYFYTSDAKTIHGNMCLPPREFNTNPLIPDISYPLRMIEKYSAIIRDWCKCLSDKEE